MDSLNPYMELFHLGNETPTRPKWEKIINFVRIHDAAKPVVVSMPLGGKDDLYDGNYEQ